MKNNIVLILGANSDIAIAVAYRFAKAGYDIQLAARKAINLYEIKSDIEIKYKVSVTTHEFDVLNLKLHKKFIEDLDQLPNIAICAVGYMGNQIKNQTEMESGIKVIRTNFEGPANIIGILANKFEKRGAGTIVGISSVAGERGRASNYIYGSAKAGLTAFLSGLRNRLAKKNVHVITIIPGFVATKMTSNLKLPKILTAQPEKVARVIFLAVKKKSNVVYVKSIWLVIMMIIKKIPERIFKIMDI
jgi:short-subunit dehydrogenase